MTLLAIYERGVYIALVHLALGFQMFLIQFLH